MLSTCFSVFKTVKCLRYAFRRGWFCYSGHVLTKNEMIMLSCRNFTIIASWNVRLLRIRELKKLFCLDKNNVVKISIYLVLVSAHEFETSRAVQKKIQFRNIISTKPYFKSYSVKLVIRIKYSDIFMKPL